MSAEQIRLVAIALASCLSTSLLATALLWLVLLGSARRTEQQARMAERMEQRERRGAR